MYYILYYIRKRGDKLNIKAKGQYYPRTPVLPSYPSTTLVPQYYPRTPVLPSYPSTTLVPQYYSRTPELPSYPSTTLVPQYYPRTPVLPDTGHPYSPVPQTYRGLQWW